MMRCSLLQDTRRSFKLCCRQGRTMLRKKRQGQTAERGARKGGHTKVEKLLADWARNAREEEL